MAIYHLSIKIFSRGKGRSAVAAAAYRSAELIKSEYDGRINNYTRKSGVAYTEIMLPAHAPSEYKNRSVLWNAVEKVEKSKNAQLAREVEFALPAELTQEQNIALARDYVKRNFVDKGMCADICIHDKGDGKIHAHVMLTMRPINEDGTWGSKQKKEYILDDNGNKIYDPKKRQYKCRSIPSTDWNEQTNAERWREDWAKSVNATLEKANISDRIDHRSYTRQGLTIKPSIKLGVAAHQMELRGICTERGDINREIAVTNQKIRQLAARIRKEKNQLYSLPLDKVPSMIDVATRKADWHNLNTQWQKIAHLQAMVRTVNFLIENDVRDFSELAAKAAQMYEDTRKLADDVKKAERRLDTLANHLAQWDILKTHKSVALKLNNLKGKKRDEYYAKYKREIEAYRNAVDYFKKVMNGRTDIPVKKWDAEKKNLTAERITLGEQYYDLKDEIKVVESLRRNAEILMKEALPKRLSPMKGAINSESQKPPHKSAPEKKGSISKKLELAKKDVAKKNADHYSHRQKSSDLERLEPKPQGVSTQRGISGILTSQKQSTKKIRKSINFS